MTGVYEAGISASFHATHSLKGDFGPACEVHPHDYRVDISVVGDRLMDEGILIDIVQLEQSITAIIAPWNNQCLDSIPELQGVNTTVEALARHIHDRVSVTLGERRDLALEVKIWESAAVWGAYRARLASDSQ